MIPLRTATRKDHSDIDEQIKLLHDLKTEQQKKSVLQSYVTPQINDRHLSSYYDVVCPFCHKNFHRSKILKHLATSHHITKKATKSPKANRALKVTGVKSKKTKAKTINQFELKNFVTCEICNVKVMTKRIKKHMEKVHSQIQTQITIATAVASKFKLNTLYKFVVCTKCNRHIPQSEYEAHCILHQTGNTKFLSKSKSGPSIVNIAIQETKPGSRALPGGQKVSNNLDATYGSHIIRDVGRFGSHPSHDNFDDESEA